MTMLCVGKYVLVLAPSQFKDLPKPVQELNDFTERVFSYSRRVCELLPGDSVLTKFDRLMRSPIHADLSSRSDGDIS
jgi:hypothetical protein